MKRDSVVIYKSFINALEGFDDKTKCKILLTVINYGLEGEIGELSGVEKAVFTLIKPQIDANNKRYENSLKGGRPKKLETAIEKTKPKPNDNENDNENENVNVNVNEKENEKEKENENEEESKKVSYDYGEKKSKLKSYQSIIEDFQVEKELQPTLWEFIKHCQLNGKTLTNDKLMHVIVKLDMGARSVQDKIDKLVKAISLGHFDVER